VTRAEVLGLVGMLPMKEKGARFSIKSLSLSDQRFSEELKRVQKSEGPEKFRVECTPEELEQFNYNQQDIPRTATTTP
jgi:hypothetical protein